MMNQKEERRLRVIRGVLNGWTTNRKASSALGLSMKQLRRILTRVRDEGAAGVCHRLKGRKSNRMYAPELRRSVERIYAEKYSHLGPAAAQRRIAAECGIRVSRETLRKWLAQSRLWRAGSPGHF